MGTLVKMPGKGVARPSSSRGLDLMNQAIEPFAPALAISKRYSVRWEASIGAIGLVYTGHGREIPRDFLPAFVEMDRACDTLRGIKSGHPEVDRVSALSMLNVLFAAIGKRKSDEDSALLLAAAADMFNPANDVLGCITKVERINRHPLILASAIKKLIATAKFTSCAELHEAMQSVEHFIGIQVWHLEFMTERIYLADAILFEQDRTAWDKAYANVDCEVVLAMRESSEMMGEGPFPEDGEFPATPGSPRWQALDDLVKAKSQPRRVACETTVAKRTRKPKPVEV